MKKLVVALIMISCLGCLPSGRPGTKQEKQTDSMKVEYRTPIVTIDSKGKVNVSYESYSFEQASMGQKSEAPKPTIMEKLGRWIGGLSIIGIVLLALGFGAPLATAITWLFSAWRNARSGLREVVKAVKEAKAVDTNEQLANALRSNLSASSKELIGKIKARL